MAASVAAGREAFARRDWEAAYASLAAGGATTADDLERLAVAAHLVGRDDESADAWQRAQHAYDHGGDARSAARCAAWLALVLLLRGRAAQSGGWVARALRLATADCAAAGLARVPEFLEALGSGGQAARALSIAEEIVAVAERCGDRDVLALGLLCRGEALLLLDDAAGGMRCFDEAMVLVTSDEVSPVPAGIVYCGVIGACVEVFDLRRAAEWTDALDRWCAAQPGIVPYRGACLVHRSQVLLARGAWTDAGEAASDAMARLAEVEHPAVGSALYQLAELHRLRGDLDEAAHAYRAAAAHGCEPAPGLAQLRLAAGDVAAARSAVERMVGEHRGSRTCAPILAAAVEIRLADGDVLAAREGADELRAIAASFAAPLLEAAADYADGCVLLAEGAPSKAVAPLRAARQRWHDGEQPYDRARAQVQLAAACRRVGDDDAAELELAAARATFERLGARPALERLDAVVAGAARPDGLTARECEVLRAVATGMTNRDVAGALHISEHTVARHLQNIFAKLGLTSRTAATAYAHTHGLV